MKTIIRSASTAALVALVLGVAAGRVDAAPFTASHDPEPNVTITTLTPYAFALTIVGFNAATDTVDAATLGVTLSDNGGAEGIRYSFEGTIINQNNTGNSAQTYTFDFGALSILSTLADGVLNVTMSATSGSYIFNAANLEGTYTRTLPPPPPPPNGVPEPASLVLLGVGLLGAGFARRRRVG